MIVLEKITKIFGEDSSRTLPVLRGIDLQIEKGASYVVLGRSGVGKSVLLKVLLGLFPMTSGDAFVEGLSVHDRTHRHTYLRYFGMLFQGGALFDSMTILGNIVFALTERGVPRKQATEIAREKLTAVGLGEARVRTLFPSELSGGMQKRAALARAIALDPKILLFDEPTTGLDPITSSKIAYLLRDTVQTLGATAITITHDLVTARVLADRICLLEDGQIAWQGTQEELETTDNPQMISLLKAAKGERAL
ncbi:MAG: ATP-binding cassette domain-containing protein [Holosporales bacterium]|jgi:phospholipid/cholesterol/gamma-HCH transport system ATP-binding protein|nr:ATP-binding cassette domain-containing protein [Holosporales bacterium]